MSILFGLVCADRQRRFTTDVIGSYMRSAALGILADRYVARCLTDMLVVLLW